jgi:hypothetical protein
LVEEMSGIAVIATGYVENAFDEPVALIQMIFPLFINKNVFSNQSNQRSKN